MANKSEKLTTEGINRLPWLLLNKSHKSYLVYVNMITIELATDMLISMINSYVINVITIVKSSWHSGLMYVQIMYE